MSSLLQCLVVIAALGSTIAFPGAYVPKSFYTIDREGHKSDVIYLRQEDGARFRRSASNADANIAFDGPSGIAAHVQAGLTNTFQQLRNLAEESGAQGGGHSGGYSSASGPGLAGGQGGPVIYSRFAGDASGSEKELVTGGNGQVRASASASGPNGGFGFSSSSVDANGNVRYNTHARKF